MSKGIKRIIISEEDISSGQLIKFPKLLNGCEVYGLRANGKSVTLSVEIDEKVLSDVEDKVKNKQIHSGIKWVYGKVNSLQKGGISWHGWYRDANRNNKKDGNEEWILNTSIEQISKIDVHNVQGNYNIQNTIQIKFDNESYDTPTLSWVEAFLIHPELHFSKAPKGIFIVPIAEPKIYRTDLIINNSPFHRTGQMFLPKTEKESQENDHVVYYGENLLFALHTCTLSIPEDAEFTVIIDQKEQFGSDSGFLGVKIERHKTIYEKKVNGLKPENDDFWSEDLDYELVSYLSHYFKRAELLIPLALDNKPEDQKEKSKRTFSVTLKHIYPAYTATDTDLKKLYPTLYGYLTIGYTDMYSLLEIQNKEVDEYVEKAGDILLQPNGDPCHYTWIKAHKEDKEITLFEEKKEGIKLNPVEISLIAGDEKPYLLTLSTNLKTEECKTQQHTQGADSVFYFPANLSSEKQGIKIQKIDYSSVDLLIPYKYIRDHSTLGVINDFPFNYFWFNEKDVQKHVIIAETCRYSIPVKINVFPDIKWTLLISFNFNENDFRNYIEKEEYKLNTYRIDYIQVDSAGIAKPRSKTIAQISKTQNKKPKTKKGGFNGILDIIKRFEASLTVEYGGKDGKMIKRDMTEETVKQYYRFIMKIYEIYKLVKEFCNGEVSSEDKTRKKQFEKEVEKMQGGRSVQGAIEVLDKQSKKTEILYPSVAASVTWFYKKIEDNKQPQINGKVGVQTEIKLKADPIIGVKVSWDILELIARRHPIAYIIKKVFDLKLYLMNPENGVNINFSVAGQIDFETTFNHNSVSENIFTRGYSPQRDEPIKIDGSIEAKLEGKIDLEMGVYLIITEINSSGKFQIGVTGKIGIKPHIGTDKDGIYMTTQPYSDGLTFYLKVKSEYKLVFFGFTIIDWNYDYEPKPYTCGKYQVDAVKYYFNNPDKNVQYWEVIPDEN